MNCAEWEESVALYAGGDLAGDQAARVERHLGECAGCQVFVSGIRQSLEALQTAHAEPPAEAMLAAIRARVVGRLSRRRYFAWAFGAVTAAAALVVAVALQSLRQPLPAVPVVAVRTPPAPAEAFRIPKLAARVSRRPTIARTRVEPVLIRMETDNPDVVIYWITETKGY